MSNLLYKGVPTSADLENNSNQKKYTVNENSGKGLYISKPLCTLMAVGAILLAILVGLIVFFLVPRSDCSAISNVENLTKDTSLLKAEEIDERLPRDVEPTHYLIRMIPNFQNETTNGSVSIRLKVSKETDTIIFHINEIEIDKDSVTVQTNGTSLPIKSQSSIEGQRYKITLDDPLKLGQEYLLDVQFVGELNKHLQGFYKMSYYLYDNKITAASTQFSPTDARRAFPCFDEPIFKAKFTIHIARPGNMSSLSNMPLKKTDPMDNMPGWYLDQYKETPKMSTYLVAFLVSTLATESPQNSFIRIWSQENLVKQTAFANELAPKILRYFEDYFSIKFPLPKIDIAAVPEFGFNAMENWGLITFRESSLLFNETTTTTENEKNIATILGHEIAHQWFGNLVTPKWWNDLWLKEGFASYLEYLGVDAARPGWQILDEFISVETRQAFRLDSLESSRPISFTVVNSKQIRQTFDDISYAKGACIIRMMNHFLGEETFKNGLINFLNKYKWGNADREDLFTSLTEEAHKSKVLEPNDTVKVIMDSWTEQPGFPVLTAMADYDKRVLKITQKRFLLTSSKDHDATWWVPVSIATDKVRNMSTKPSVWLKGEKSIETPLDWKDWYLLNLNQTGYYIVNYDEKNWRSIIDNIMVFEPIIRTQLISDSMDLARANLLDYDIPLRLISRMAVQDQAIMFLPTIVTFKKLEFLSDMLANTPAYGLFEEYHNEIFRSTYKLVDFDDSIDDYLTKRIRSAVLEWSCRSAESRCSYESRDLYRRWMSQGKTVSPNVRYIVYCTAIREGTHFEWQWAYNEYLKTQIPAEKNVLLDAMGCTKEKWLLSRYLDLLIDETSSIRIQDADRVFSSIAKNKIGTSLAFDFLRKNWNNLQEHYGEGFSILSSMIKSLANNMNTEFQLNEFKQFRDNIKDNISTTAQAFDSAIETIKANSEWMNNIYESLENWFVAHKNNYSL